MDNGAECYRRYRNGDDAGLAEMIDEYGDGLIFYLNTYVHNLSVAEELASKEIAQVMKKSVNSVDHLLSRARRSLRTKLDKEDFLL